MTARHVRILTALFAAVILHALLLSWSPPSSHRITIHNGLLHVDLLKVDKPSEARPESASPATAIADTQSKLQQKSFTQAKRPKSSQTQQHTRTVVATRQFTPLSAPLKTYSAENKARSTARQEAEKSDLLRHSENTQVAGRLTVSHDESSAAHLPSTLAAEAQAMLLANIHYPPQARRHGWQGAGEFQLDIDSQSISRVTMLMSTGHAILDRAVRRGLDNVEHVPVANGQYRLPVEFRLQ